MKPLGRTQAIALGTLLVPFLTVTGFVLLGKADVSDWSAFLQYFLPSIVIPLLAGGAVVKWKTGGAKPTETAIPEAQE